MRRLALLLLCSLLLACAGGQEDRDEDPTLPEECDAFYAHYDAWLESWESPTPSTVSSSERALTEHPEWRAMVTPGKAVLPCIIDAIESGDPFLTRAAREVTGVDLFGPAAADWRAGGRIGRPPLPDDEARLWIEWWSENRDDPRWRP